jgi:ribosome-associated heat shock protein Hsp15
MTEIRIDKWLWAVRLFPTRSTAIEACRAGHVKVGGESVKPAHPARPGTVLTVQKGPVLRTVRILSPLERRVGAKQVPKFCEDLTPPEELAKRESSARQPGFDWPKGRGRPTKRDRRVLERLWEDPPAPEQ